MIDFQLKQSRGDQFQTQNYQHDMFLKSRGEAKGPLGPERMDLIGDDKGDMGKLTT